MQSCARLEKVGETRAVRVASRALLVLLAGVTGCTHSSPPSPERGAVGVTVDTTMTLGPVVTGGGTNFTASVRTSIRADRAP
jgi:hypothetical protein